MIINRIILSFNAKQIALKKVREKVVSLEAQTRTNEEKITAPRKKSTKSIKNEK